VFTLEVRFRFGDLSAPAPRSRGKWRPTGHRARPTTARCDCTVQPPNRARRCTNHCTKGSSSLRVSPMATAVTIDHEERAVAPGAACGRRVDVTSHSASPRAAGGALTPLARLSHRLRVSDHPSATAHQITSGTPGEPLRGRRTGGHPANGPERPWEPRGAADAKLDALFSRPGTAQRLAGQPRTGKHLRARPPPESHRRPRAGTFVPAPSRTLRPASRLHQKALT